jgi:RNA polymerase-binding transcription factor DksA
MATGNRPFLANPSEVRQIADLLSSRRKALAAMLHASVADLRDEGAMPGGEELSGGDGGVAESAVEREVMAAGHLADELRAVDEAEKRLASGQYGICEDCGEPIAFDRLLVEPEAIRCVTCQARREIRPS